MKHCGKKVQRMVKLACGWFVLNLDISAEKHGLRYRSWEFACDFILTNHFKKSIPPQVLYSRVKTDIHKRADTI